jgi:hypothetical protein
MRLLGSRFIATRADGDPDHFPSLPHHTHSAESSKASSAEAFLALKISSLYEWAAKVGALSKLHKAVNLEGDEMSG